MIYFYDIYNLLTCKLPKNSCIEINFTVNGYYKYQSCWMGVQVDENNNANYWYGLTDTETYDFDNSELFINATVFDGKSLTEIWDEVVLLSIDGCKPEERIITQNTTNNFHEYDWADSDINKIEIEYNCVKLYIFNDALQKDLVVNCSGFIGMTDLCIWDDQIIDYAEVIEIKDSKHSPFTEKIFSAYGININYGEGTLKPEFFEVRFTLANQITFKIYCQAINVDEN